MKHHTLFIFAGIVALFTSCAKETGKQGAEPVYFSVSLDSETTKATLAEGDGAFAFSSGDAIKIFDGSAVKSGTTTSTSNSGNFAMESGFNPLGAGFAGFPAGLVEDITTSGVTFSLPAAGSRYRTKVTGCDPSNNYYDGQYWSSSQADGLNAFYVYFNPSQLETQNTYYRYGGFSVRLVRNAND